MKTGSFIQHLVVPTHTTLLTRHCTINASYLSNASLYSTRKMMVNVFSKSVQKIRLYRIIRTEWTFCDVSHGFLNDACTFLGHPQHPVVVQYIINTY